MALGVVNGLLRQLCMCRKGPRQMTAEVGVLHTATTGYTEGARWSVAS